MLFSGKKVIVAAVAVTLVLAVSAFAQKRLMDPRLRGEGPLKVMTYNMYAGTEYAGVTASDPAVFLQAVTDMFAEAEANDPAGRALAIARQISITRPHLVSLQEVATWSRGPTRDDLTLEYDYLELLLDALDALGEDYMPVASLTTWDTIVPSSTGLYVRNTWREAILARADLDPRHFSFTNIQAAPWSAGATISFPLPALNGSSDCPVPLEASGACMMPFPRGWVSVDVTYRNKQFRFIDAHLESKSASKNFLESLELLNGPALTALPVIVAGDLNCDLGNPESSKYQTCMNFLNTGFRDAWNEANPAEPGYTKHLPIMTERSDYVMIRDPIFSQAAFLVGEEPEDRTPSGLWPGDHCGVVARLQFSFED